MPSPPAAIDLRSLRVDYGSVLAVDDLSLRVGRGEIFGMVGPNGAGKTSTLRVISTLMEPTYGHVSLEGIDVFEHPEEARRIIGYMPDLAPVPSDLKIIEFLKFYALCHGLGTPAQCQRRAEECLEQVAMSAERHRWCKELSRGQTQRVVLAKTLLHRPKILILDEPASGLDPLARRELRMTLKQVAREGTTVLISSHILSELAEMCTSVCVMSRGRLLASGTVDEVRDQLGNSQRQMTLALLDRHEHAVGWLAVRDAVDGVELLDGRIVFGFTGSDDQQADLITEFVGAGFRLRSIEEKRSSMEELLVEIASKSRQP